MRYSLYELVEKVVQIGRIPEELKPKVADLWSLSFEVRSRDFWMDWFEADEIKLFGAYNSEDVYAVVGLYDFETRLAGRWVPCGGIAGVASNPSHRGGGLVRKVMIHCLKELDNNEIPIAILGTGIHSFYERMGFATTDWHYTIEASTRALAMFRKYGDSKRYRMIPIDEFAHCIPIHDQWTAQSALSIRRSEGRWRRHVFAGDHVGQLFLHDNGYMAIDLTATQTENKVKVLDWAHLTDQAYFDGLALIAQMGSQYDSATWTDWDPERLLKQGMLEQAAKVSVHPGQMSRVVNLNAFERTIGRSLNDLVIRDPLDLIGKNGGQGLSPGQVIQLVTGFWQKAPESWPSELYGCLSRPRAFTCERF